MDLFIVCGLGSVGQNCVVALKEFGVRIIAIDQLDHHSWEIPHLPTLLDKLITGDCRSDQVLNLAQIRDCRAALLVNSDEQVNAETALAIRKLNPTTRLIVRSTKTNLNQLLSEQLGNFVAYDPSHLPASAFAVAGLGKEMLGFFYLDGRALRIIKSQIFGGDRFSCQNCLLDLNNSNQRILSYSSNTNNLPQSFYQWNPNAIPHSGDIVTYIETCERVFDQKKAAKKSPKKFFSWLKLLPNTGRFFLKEIQEFWSLSFQQRVQRVAIFSAFIVTILLIIATFLINAYAPKSSLTASFYASAILLMGGYGDLFGDLEDIPDIPWWLQLFSFMLTLVGTAFVGVLYALVTEALLESKFQLRKKRPPVPEQDHIVIIGMGRVGQQVAKLLQEFQEPIVGVSFNLEIDQSILPEMPLIIGNINEAIARTNIINAKSVVIVTDEEMFNLEMALMVYKINPDCHLVVRTQGRGLCRHVTSLLPQAQVLQVYRVAAEAFAGAAFGENILYIFRCHGQTILVTEYRIEASDTLHGLLLSEMVYGYGVVSVLYQKPDKEPVFMPSDDIKLTEGDRLVVLATIKSLQRIEKGDINLKDKCWRVQVEKALTPEAAFEGANALIRIAGCSLVEAREIFNQLPQTLPKLLYQHQAQRLIKELNKSLVKASMSN